MGRAVVLLGNFKEQHQLIEKVVHFFSGSNRIIALNFKLMSHVDKSACVNHKIRSIENPEPLECFCIVIRQQLVISTTSNPSASKSWDRIGIDDTAHCARG